MKCHARENSPDFSKVTLYLILFLNCLMLYEFPVSLKNFQEKKRKKESIISERTVKILILLKV